MPSPLFCRADDDKLEVPLQALVPAPDVQFNSLLNMGTVTVDNIRTEWVDFTNEGSVDTTVTLQAEDDKALRIAPTELVLGAKGEWENIEALREREGVLLILRNGGMEQSNDAQRETGGE